MKHKINMFPLLVSFGAMYFTWSGAVLYKFLGINGLLFLSIAILGGTIFGVLSYDK